MPAIAIQSGRTAGDGCFPPTPYGPSEITKVKVNGEKPMHIGIKCPPHTCGKNIHADGARMISDASGTVFFEGRKVARVGDPLVDGDCLAVGSGNVFAG